jgi:hypothetical protein
MQLRRLVALDRHVNLCLDCPIFLAWRMAALDWLLAGYPISYRIDLILAFMIDISAQGGKI